MQFIMYTYTCQVNRVRFDKKVLWQRNILCGQSKTCGVSKGKKKGKDPPTRYKHSRALIWGRRKKSCPAPVHNNESSFDSTSSTPATNSNPVSSSPFSISFFASCTIQSSFPFPVKVSSLRFSEDTGHRGLALISHLFQVVVEYPSLAYKRQRTTSTCVFLTNQYPFVQLHN